MSIVTLTTAKLHLRVDDSAEDAAIQIYLDAAEQSIAQHLGVTLYETDVGDDTTGLVVTSRITAAILLLTGHLFANRESVSMAAGNYMIELPMGVQYLTDLNRTTLGV